MTQPREDLTGFLRGQIEDAIELLRDLDLESPDVAAMHVQRAVGKLNRALDELKS